MAIHSNNVSFGDIGTAPPHFDVTFLIFQKQAFYVRAFRVEKCNFIFQQQ